MPVRCGPRDYPTIEWANREKIMQAAYEGFDRVTMLADVPAGWSFCRAWDGWRTGDTYRTYAPRHEYEMLDNGRVRDMTDGRTWDPFADCGMEPSTAVRVRYRIR